MITLVLGGTRSGKSAVAESAVARAASSRGDERVTYVATAIVTRGDAEMEARIERHVARRPPTWATVESGSELPAALASLADTAQTGDRVLIDSLGTWLAACPDLTPATDKLVAALGRLRATGVRVVVVSEEVGLGVHAPTEVGRRFADALGELNQAVGEIADHVWLVVAGRVLTLTSPADLD